MNSQHLTREELLMAVVDIADLATEQREHLAACPTCRDAHARLEERFKCLGRMAQQLAPAPGRSFRLPDPQAAAAGWRFKPLWAMGIAAAMVLAVLLGRPLWPAFSPEPALTATRLEEDRQFMEAVDALVEDALPITFQHLASLDEEDAQIAPESDDEEMIDWVVPSIDENDDSIT